MDRRPGLFYDRGGACQAFHSAQRWPEVGVQHIRHAYSLQAGGPGAKAVLLCLADRACDTCGLAWPGLLYVSERTEIPEKRARVHVHALVEAGLLLVHAYSKGGRGVSTEYIVLPGFTKLSTAPCEKCAQLKKTPPTRGGFIGRPGAKPSPGDRGNPPATGRPSIREPLSISTPQGNPGGEPAGSAGTVSAARPMPDGRDQATLDFLASLGVHPPSPHGHPAAKERQRPEPGPGSPGRGKGGSLERD